MAELGLSSTIRNFPKYDGITSYRTWADKARVIINLSNKEMFQVMEGSMQPIQAGLNSDL